MTWLYVALSLNIVVLVTLAAIVWRLHSHLKRLRESTAELGGGERSFPPEWREQGPRTLITLEILNPLSLVAERSWIGGKFSALSPGLMRRIVLTQTRDQLRNGLKENGVEVDVRLVRLG
ncbi:MAG: hypothetical protein CMN84_06410 [Spongiibacteraceae bacterium]|nr:hypothetical protein [Spongiibacteraceae bacterium]